MQVARIRYKLKSGLGAKFVQLGRALQLEFYFTKQDILTYYLNHAPFGGPWKGLRQPVGVTSATLHPD